MADKKVRIGSEVDATGAKKGFDKIKADAKGMADDVKKSGESAGTGIGEGIGAGAETAKKRVNKANSALNQSIRRQIGALQRSLAEQGSSAARGTRAYFQEYAKLRGADLDKLENNLRELETIEKRVNGVVKETTTQTKAAGHQVGNLAAQFQDIAVSAQGGLSPLTIALQQGTQISAVMGQAGAAGAVGMLGGALRSVISPLSLAVIGITAITALGIQWVGSLMDSSDEMETLEEKTSAFNSTLSLLSQNTLNSQNSLENIRKKYGAVTKEIRGLIEETNKYNRYLISSQVTDLIAGRLDEYAKSISTTFATVDFSKSAYDITNVRRLQEELGVTREQAIELNKQFREVGEVKGFDNQSAALKSLGVAIDSLGVGVENDFIRKLRADLARLQLDLIETKKVTEESVESFQKPIIPTAKVSEADKKYANLNKSINENILANNVLATSLSNADRSIGDSAYQTGIFKREIELVTAAKKADIPITAELAKIYRNLAISEAESAKRVAEAQDRLDNPKLSIYESMTAGADDWVKKYEDSGKLVRNAISGAFDSAADAITEFVIKGEMDITRFTQSILAQFVKIAIQSAVIQPIAASLFGGAGAAGGGSAGTVASARGNAFVGGNVQAFAKGGVVSSPTYFPMSGNKTGLMGEAGDEAIMPLTRDAKGRLGVSSEGGGNVNINFQLINQSSQELSSSQQQAFYDEDMKSFVVKAVIEDYQDGGATRGLIGER